MQHVVPTPMSSVLLGSQMTAFFVHLLSKCLVCYEGTLRVESVLKQCR